MSLGIAIFVKFKTRQNEPFPIAGPSFGRTCRFGSRRGLGKTQTSTSASCQARTSSHAPKNSQGKAFGETSPRLSVAGSRCS